MRLIRRGRPDRARRKLEGKDAEIRAALEGGDETLASLATTYGVSRWTLARFVRERLEGGEDAANEKVEK